MSTSDINDPNYWYFNRHSLDSGMVFMTHSGELVKLDRGVPGDGTKWYVASWMDTYWSYDDGTIEPGDLAGAQQSDPAV